MMLIYLALSIVTPSFKGQVVESTVEYTFKTSNKSVKASNKWDVVSKGTIAEIEISKK